MFMYCTYTLHKCYITVGYGTREHNLFGDRRARVVWVKIPGKGHTVIWDGMRDEMCRLPPPGLWTNSCGTRHVFPQFRVSHEIRIGKRGCREKILVKRGQSEDFLCVKVWKKNFQYYFFVRRENYSKIFLYRISPKNGNFFFKWSIYVKQSDSYHSNYLCRQLPRESQRSNWPSC
jgi:hypothetical protein